MNPFAYSRPASLADTVNELAGSSRSRIIAGGTNLIDLMKENVERPAQLIDINRLPFSTIDELPDGGLRLGALVTNADTAYHPLVEQRYPLLSQTILAGASPQLRNMATNGGNLFQRTRCYYFYDTSMPCNKRAATNNGPGGCAAYGGYNRIHAILGTTDDTNGQSSCVATYPSDMAVALTALDAVVQVTGPNGDRSIPMADFHRLPGAEPWRDNTTQPGEVVTAIDLPARGFPDHYTYIKVRDRSSYAFALVSVAVGLEMDGDVVRDARIALGGVAHKPWRKSEAEQLLIGKTLSPETIRPVADALLAGARGYGHNDFKIELAHRAIIRAVLKSGLDNGAVE
ncbi:xanthine dehydrogenase family protein subunit M [Spirosoma sp. 209]|uniref:FAD binding domain-containing protein n=1 Tax=Spirosoma sp. 209 TaxID=1955701 RepID=UPI00098D2B3A|nr:xanthine dehydrogenase family protein subunit M [Spirosoma sp. 209]